MSEGIFSDAFNDVLTRVIDHARASGMFGKVQGHEPKSAPVTGRSPDLTCAAWIQEIRPTTRGGLNFTSAVLEIFVRLYTPMMKDPQDAIDPNMLGAAHRLMAAYAGDFELGGTARAVAVKGGDGAGTQLTARAGFVEIDRTMFRVMDIVVPVVINDVWQEAP